MAGVLLAAYDPVLATEVLLLVLVGNILSGLLLTSKGVRRSVAIISGVLGAAVRFVYDPDPPGGGCLAMFGYPVLAWGCSELGRLIRQGASLLKKRFSKPT